MNLETTARLALLGGGGPPWLKHRSNTPPEKEEIPDTDNQADIDPENDDAQETDDTTRGTGGLVDAHDLYADATRAALASIDPSLPDLFSDELRGNAFGYETDQRGIPAADELIASVISGYVRSERVGKGTFYVSELARLAAWSLCHLNNAASMPSNRPSEWTDTLIYFFTMALASHETGYRANLINTIGAVGYIQMLPSTIQKLYAKDNTLPDPPTFPDDMPRGLSAAREWWKAGKGQLPSFSWSGADEARYTARYVVGSGTWARSLLNDDEKLALVDQALQARGFTPDAKSRLAVAVYSAAAVGGKLEKWTEPGSVTGLTPPERGVANWEVIHKIAYFGDDSNS